MIEYSFVVPIYNESQVLGEFYAKLKDVADRLKKPYEIIFSTGGNTDATLEALKELHQKDKRVKVINLSHRFD